MTSEAFRGYAVTPPTDLSVFLATELARLAAGHAFFFLRWSKPGPHLRLRIARSLAPAAVLAAPFCVRRASYRPDVRRMGGQAAVPYVHAVQVAASRLACRLLGEGVPPATGALLAGATLMAGGFIAASRGDAVDTVLTSLWGILGVNEGKRAGVERAFAVPPASARRLAPIVATLLDGSAASDPTFELASAVAALGSALRCPERRRRVLLRELHLLHNRFGFEGVPEIGALVRLRAFIAPRGAS